MGRPPIVTGGADTRGVIVAAAWELAGREGIASLSVRELAASVGMRAPSLYHHFDGKSAIYDAMFRQGHEAVNELVAQLDPPSAPRLGMVATCRAWLDFCRSDWTRYQLMYTRVIPDWRPTPDAYAVAVAGLDAMRRTLADFGLDEQGSDLFMAIAAGLAAQQFANDPAGERWLALAPGAMEMLHDHLVADAGLDPTHKLDGAS